MNLKNFILEEINNFKKNIDPIESPIGIQIPEGLKQYSNLILEELKKYKPILFMDPCYGACDIKDKEAEALNLKLLIHFGHYQMYKPKIKTIFIPIKYNLEEEHINFIIKNIKELNYNTINLVTTIQYLTNIPKIKKKLLENNITVEKCKSTNRVLEHMLLGCDCTTIINKKTPIVFIGDGYFHTNNLAFNYKTDIWAINPLSKTKNKIKINDKFIKIRYGIIAKARTCNNFGILVSSKKGQNRLKLAYEIKERLEKINKKAFIFISDFINENYILGTDIDCLVNTACPRITYDDQINYTLPILSPNEVDLLEDLTKELKIDQIN